MEILYSIGCGVAFSFGAFVGIVIGLVTFTLCTKKGRDEWRVEQEKINKLSADHFAKQLVGLTRIAEAVEANNTAKKS